jgi:hypothetical protein
MITVARRPRGGLRWKDLPVAQRFEGDNAIRRAGMPIKIDYNQASTAKLDCGHSTGKLRPPLFKLGSVGRGLCLPIADGGLLIELLSFLVPANERRKNRDPRGCKLKGGGKGHGAIPALEITLTP